MGASCGVRPLCFALSMAHLQICFSPRWRVSLPGPQFCICEVEPFWAQHRSKGPGASTCFCPSRGSQLRPGQGPEGLMPAAQLEFDGEDEKDTRRPGGCRVTRSRERGAAFPAEGVQRPRGRHPLATLLGWEQDRNVDWGAGAPPGSCQQRRRPRQRGEDGARARGERRGTDADALPPPRARGSRPKAGACARGSSRSRGRGLERQSRPPPAPPPPQQAPPRHPRRLGPNRARGSQGRSGHSGHGA